MTTIRSLEQESALKEKNMNLTKDNKQMNKDIKQLNKQSLAFMSLIRKDQQNTTKRHNKISYRDYSQIFTSFNKRMADLYSQEPQNVMGEIRKEQSNYEKLVQTESIPENPNHHSIVTPFSIQPMGIKTPLPGYQKLSSQFSLSSQEHQQSISITNSSPYGSFSQVDPYLLEIGTQLDEQHKKQKEEILQQTFIKRYQQLLDKQRKFEGYQESVSLQITQLERKVLITRKQLSDAHAFNTETLQKINTIQQAHLSTIKNLNIKHEQQREKLMGQIESLTQTLKQKDKQIISLHQVTTKQLQSKLDEQVQQNVQLKKSLNSFISQINTKNELLSKNDQKQSQLIETLQLTLTHSETEKNKLSEDLERVCEELQALKETLKAVNKKLKKQQTENDLKTNEMSLLQKQFTDCKQATQQEVYSHKIKYLQEIKEKNAIIEQYESTKQQISSIGYKLTQAKQQLFLSETQNQEIQKSLKTERQIYLENCAQYEAKLSELREYKEKSSKHLKQTQEKLQILKKQTQNQLEQYRHQIATLSAELSSSQKLQKQYIDLNNFKHQKQQQFQVSKQSFSQITHELKSQLQKAKEIILSKNSQINSTRQMVHSLKKELTQLKCSYCEVENQLSEMVVKRENDKTNWEARLNQEREKFDSFEKEKIKQITQLKSLVKELNQKVLCQQKQMNKKETKISSLNLQIETSIKQNKQQNLQLIELQNTIKTKQKESRQKLQNCQLQNEQQIKEISNEHEIEVSTLRQVYEKELKQKSKKIQQVSQQLSEKQKQLSALNKLVSEMREQQLSIISENRQFQSQISVLQQKVTLSNQKQQKWREKYDSQNELILKKIKQQQLHLQFNNHQSISDQNSQARLVESQTTSIAPSDFSPESVHLCPESVHLSPKSLHKNQSSSSKQSTLPIERKYKQMIEQMKLQFMELTIFFKEKSAHQQQIRLVLENQNRQLHSQLLQYHQILKPSS